MVCDAALGSSNRALLALPFFHMEDAGRDLGLGMGERERKPTCLCGRDPDAWNLFLPALVGIGPP